MLALGCGHILLLIGIKVLEALRAASGFLRFGVIKLIQVDSDHFLRLILDMIISKAGELIHDSSMKLLSLGFSFFSLLSLVLKV